MPLLSPIYVSVTLSFSSSSFPTLSLTKIKLWHRLHSGHKMPSITGMVLSNYLDDHHRPQIGIYSLSTDHTWCTSVADYSTTTWCNPGQLIRDRFHGFMTVLKPFWEMVLNRRGSERRLYRSVTCYLTRDGRVFQSLNWLHKHSTSVASHELHVVTWPQSDNRLTIP